MCQASLPYMTKDSNIINIASVASMQPVPYINVYAASKAFVLSFSRSLNREFKKQGIYTTAVCPFWTKTEFFDRATQDENAVVKKYVAMYKSEQIVKRAFRDAKKKKDVSKFGFIARFNKDEIAVLHSKLSIGERYDEWNKIKENKASIQQKTTLLF